MSFSGWSDQLNNFRSSERLRHIQSFNLQQFHTFSLGCLDGYFHLIEDFNNNKARIAGSENQILITPRRQKAYVLDATSLSTSDLDMLRELQKTCAIYSSEPLKLVKSHTIHEVVYNLPTVFNRDSYSNSKKYKNKIGYPFRWISNNNIKIENTPRSMKDVEELHDEWVQRKLDNPKTYKIMFPQKRYIQCVYRFMDEPENINYIGRFFYDKEDRLISVRIVATNGQWAYDLANFSRFWDIPSQSSNYFYIHTLKYLYESCGIVNFNCGMTPFKSLGIFKSHYPNTNIKIHGYSKNKSEINMNNLSNYE